MAVVWAEFPRLTVSPCHFGEPRGLGITRLKQGVAAINWPSPCQPGIAIINAD
jgi:hypothetical protein